MLDSCGLNFQKEGQIWIRMDLEGFTVSVVFWHICHHSASANRHSSTYVVKKKAFINIILQFIPILLICS